MKLADAAAFILRCDGHPPVMLEDEALPVPAAGAFAPRP